VSDTYRFSNGVVLGRHELLELQLERYQEPDNPNLHEPVEEEWLLTVLNECGRSNPVFLDVGAAVGYYSILVKKTWPGACVFAVEPLPEHIDALHHNTLLNDLPSDAITLLSVAVATEDKPVFLKRQSFGSGLVSVADSDSIQVKGRRLRSLLQNIPPVDVLKMDIQGLELDVLDASRPTLKEHSIRNIIVGTHSKTIYASVKQLLEDEGYQILFSDPSPQFQPDGLIVAAAPAKTKVSS